MEEQASSAVFRRKRRNSYCRGSIADGLYGIEHGANCQMSDVSSVFSNRAITRKFSRACHVQNRLLDPSVGIGVKLGELLIRIQIGRQMTFVQCVVGRGGLRSCALLCVSSLTMMLLQSDAIFFNFV